MNCMDWDDDTITDILWAIETVIATLNMNCTVLKLQRTAGWEENLDRMAVRVQRLEKIREDLHHARTDSL